jgi:hypothetical protein
VFHSSLYYRIATVVSIRCYPVQEKKVYNLTVENDNDFFAGGILVHNCDCVDLPVMKSAEQVRKDLFNKYFGEDALKNPPPKYEPPEDSHILVNPEIEDWVVVSPPEGSTAKPVSAAKKTDYQETAWQVYAAAEPEQQRALKGYTGTGFSRINQFLYGDNSLETPEVKAEIKHLDKMIEKYYLKDDIITYRGTEAHFYKDWEVGNSYTLPAFISTSIDKNNEIVNQDFVIEFRIKKWTRGMYLGEISEHPEEDEFLLGRGRKYKVIEKTKNTMVVEVSN